MTAFEKSDSVFSPNNKIARTVAGALVCAGMVSMTAINTAFAQSAAEPTKVAYSDTQRFNDGFQRRIYGGIGMGKSWLEPDTSGVNGVKTNKRVNNGGQFMLGMDLNKWLSVEGHAALLGEAGLSSGGTIGYQTFGLSGLAYAGKNRHHFNRRGFSAFGRVGAGMLKNEPSAGVQFRQVNSVHALVGAGVEFATRMGLGLRAEAILFDTDVRYGQLSLLYRLGKRKERRMEQIVQAPVPAPTLEPAPVIAPVPAVAVAQADSDFDGVFDTLDRCPSTAAGVAVDEVGCDLFTGVIEGVNFNSGSADLTPQANQILAGVVDTLDRFPSVKLTIMAHTDSQGDNNANKLLSKQRARSVAVYLVRNGVNAKRLKAYGFGEERPIDSNETADGRLRNRRVEFRAVR